MSDFTPIDHKEKSHENRAVVLKWVQEQVGFAGNPASDAAAFVGVWQSRFHIFGQGDGDLPWRAVNYLNQDGTARSTALDGSYDNKSDRWVFNDDGSFSSWAYVEAMPEYDIPEPTYSEDRFHARFKDENTFILFNGDGSLIEYFERKEP